ncbi:MAG: SDR family oxidoreductase [Desulfobacterales bacterium]|nr:MAG: SDR family oxidoreductase [Desulfobacterales bacterium]
MARLQNKVAIVTGAAQGIGKGIAHAMAQEGATVALWDISEKVHATANAMCNSGLKAVAYTVDVAMEDQIKETAREIAQNEGRVDILVNNAGIAYFAPFMAMTPDLRDKIFGVNFNGVWNCTAAVIPMMIAQRYGRIVNVSSVTGPRVATPGLTAYAAAKGAVAAFTRSLALEVAAYAITVNALLPGFIDTALTKPMAADLHMQEDEFAAWLGKSIPLQRMGTIEEVGNLAVFLASDAAQYITGQEIVIDGGNIIQEVKGLK